MHAWRISHRDLKGGNLVVTDTPDGPDVYLIDLDGARLRRWLAAGARMRDLARLSASMRLHPWITRSCRLRFLQSYARELGLAADDWKTMWRQARRLEKRRGRRH